MADGRGLGRWARSGGLGALALGGMLLAPLAWRRTPAPAAVGEEGPADAVSQTYQALAQRAAPGVVHIVAYGTQDGVPRERARASGFVLRDDGLVVTNARPLVGADVLRVTFDDGDAVGAELVGTDPESDLALLRVPRRGLVPLSLRSAPPATVGEAVLAIGNAAGRGIGVSAGIVSGVGRAIGVATYEDFLQTDAAIHAGNRGGALLDLEGRVLGVNTAVGDAARGGHGIGFAIPAAMVAKVVGDLERFGRVPRGFLGVQLSRVDADGRPPRVGPGACVGVERVNPGSPAEAAGLRPGDVLLELEGEPLESVARTLAVVASRAPGSEVVLRIRRSGSERELRVALGERPPAEPR